MIRVNKKIIVRFLLAILIIATLFFIWSNSLENAAESTVRSDKVIHKVKPIVDPQNKISMSDFRFIVRKCAHFTEFAALGGCIFALFCAILGKIRARYTLVSAILSFVFAFTDELLQLSSSGRACRFTDMLIDSAGALTGAVIVFALLCAASRIARRMKRKPDGH